MSLSRDACANAAAMRSAFPLPACSLRLAPRELYLLFVVCSSPKHKELGEE